MRIDFQSIALGKAVTFETKQLKRFVLKFRSERSTFVKILQNLRIETPVQLRNFQEEEGSFETDHGQKIFLDASNQKIIVEENQKRRHYIVIGSYDLVPIGSKDI